MAVFCCKRARCNTVRASLRAACDRVARRREARDAALATTEAEESVKDITTEDQKIEILKKCKKRLLLFGHQRIWD
jgi:hypothetical protein